MAVVRGVRDCLVCNRGRHEESTCQRRAASHPEPLLLFNIHQGILFTANTMFDSTGILEMYCQRIAKPTQDEHGHTFPSESSTRDSFVVFVFLMERFDWMGENVASVSFSLDNGPVQDAAWVLRPAPETMLPPKPRAADEKQFHDGCFEGHRRLEVSSATLQPGI